MSLNVCTIKCGIVSVVSRVLYNTIFEWFYFMSFWFNCLMISILWCQGKTLTKYLLQNNFGLELVHQNTEIVWTYSFITHSGLFAFELLFQYSGVNSFYDTYIMLSVCLPEFISTIASVVLFLFFVAFGGYQVIKYLYQFLFFLKYQTHELWAVYGI